MEGVEEEEEIEEKTRKWTRMRVEAMCLFVGVGMLMMGK